MSNYTPDPEHERGLCQPADDPVTEAEAEAIVEQQTPIFEGGWKCPRIDNLPRF